MGNIKDTRFSMPPECRHDLLLASRAMPGVEIRGTRRLHRRVQETRRLCSAPRPGPLKDCHDSKDLGAKESVRIAPRAETVAAPTRQGASTRASCVEASDMTEAAVRGRGRHASICDVAWSTAVRTRGMLLKLARMLGPNIGQNMNSFPIVSGRWTSIS